MRGFHNSSFDPQTLVVLETAFDEAWLTLKSVGNKTVKPDELARSVLRIAMEGERARQADRAAVPSKAIKRSQRRFLLSKVPPMAQSLLLGS